MDRPAEALSLRSFYHTPAGAFPPGTSPGEALIGFVVGTLILKNIEDSKELTRTTFASRLTQILETIDIETAIEAALIEELAENPFFKGVQFERATVASDMEQPSLLNRLKESEIFTADLTISFGKELKYIAIKSIVRLWLKDDPSPIHATELDYVSEHAAETSDARQRWVLNDGEDLKKVLKEGISETARMFALDADYYFRRTGKNLEKVEVDLAKHGLGKKPGAVYIISLDAKRLLGRTDQPRARTISIPWPIQK